ncbi:MAG: O-antigen ligase family protein [Candidatus Aquicultor sp.]
MANTSSKEQLITEIDDIILWGTVAAPFIVLLVFSPLNLDYFGLPKLTALYLLTLFLVYLQARKWLATGRIEIPITASLLIAGLVLLGITITAAISANPLASFIGRFNRYESVPAGICFMIIMWFAYKAARNRLFARRFEPVFMGAFALVAVYGMLEVFGLDMLHPGFQTGGRISSTLGNPVFFGGFLAMSIPILLAKALFPPEDDKQVWDHPIIVFSLLGLGAAMLFTTMSRGAWLGALAGTIVVIYQRLKRPKASQIQSPRQNYWALLIILGALLGIIFSVSLNLGTTRVLDMARASGSLESRIEIWKSSLHMIADRPLTGYGLGQTSDWFNKYTTVHLARIENSFNDRAHNIYLQMAIDGGLPLLLAQLWLIIYVLANLIANIISNIFAKGMRSIRQEDRSIAIGLLGTMVAYLTQGLTGIATNELSTFFWFIMGASTGLVTKHAVYLLRHQVNRGVVLKVVAIPTLLLLAVAAITPLAVEARYYALSNEADTTLSDSALENAYAFGTYCAVQPYYQWHLANVCLDFTGDRDDPRYARLAIAPIKRGLRYSPEYPQLLHTLGKAYLTSARYTKDKRDLDLADLYLNRARDKAPLSLGISVDLLELYLRKKKLNEVIQCAESVRTFEGSNLEALVAESAAYELKGDTARAKELLSEAVKSDPNAKGMKDRLLSLVGDSSSVKAAIKSK